MAKPGWGIKPLTTTRIPSSMMFLTVATRLLGDRTGYAESFRWSSLTWRKDPPGQGLEERRTSHESLSTLWIAIAKLARGQGLTFLWVHDLSRTARLTNLFHWLPEFGWSLDALSLNPGAPWLVWRRKDDTLKVADVMSVWPTSLDKTGQFFGLSRKPTPEDKAPALAWISHVHWDNWILRTAVESYVDWIRRENLGSLSVTGNGQAWSAFRRRFMDLGILVHHEEDLLAMERRAMWTGRCEAFWHGTLLKQVVDEWDFTSAHTHIAEAEDMPVFPHGPIDPAVPLAQYLDDDRYHVLAEVDIVTDTPCVPAEAGEHIVWPTGAFRTVLWSPELRIALDRCTSVRVRRGWLYRRAPALRRWANWVFAQLAADDVVTPAWQKDLIKRWGNVLVGRFAMRYPQWTKVGRAPESDVHCTPCTDAQTGEEFLLMQVGHDLWQQTGQRAPNNTAPMITGYVMSVMRAKLWKLMQAMEPDELLYVDTDSLLVTDRWRWHLQELAQTGAGQGLRLKRSWDGMAIYGPRQIVTGDSVRIAGLPKTAVRTGRHEWEGETTESLTAAMAGRSADVVRTMPRDWKVVGTDTRRDGPAIGWTWPITVGGEDVPDVTQK